VAPLAPLAGPLGWKDVTVPLRPYETYTLYLDLAEGRKQTRDLDSRCSVWATALWVSKEGEGAFHVRGMHAIRRFWGLGEWAMHVTP